MPKVLIVYHSHTGNTEVMAKAIRDGVVSAGAKVTLKKAVEATAKDILNCEIVAFGTPNNFNYMAGAMKDFFDRLWLTIGNRTGSKLYTTFSSSRGGGRGAIEVIESIENICETFNKWTQVNFKKALQGIVATGKPSAQILQDCKEMGSKLAQL